MANETLYNIQQVIPLSNKTNPVSARPFRAKQIKEYGVQVLTFVEESKLLARYIAKINVDPSTTTAKNYKAKLTSFCNFIYKMDSKTSLDDTISKIAAGEFNPFDLLQDYAT